MKKKLINGAVFLILFGASAGGSWYYSVMSKPESESADDVVQDSSIQGTAQTYRPEELQQVYRPKDLGPEAILSLSRRLEEREQAVIDKEELLKRQTYQVNMLVDDMQREQNELASLHAQLEAEIGRAQKVLQEVSAKHQELHNAKAELEDAVSQNKKEVNAIDEAEIEQINQIATYYAGMPEDKSASLLKEMCDGGRIEFAAKVVSAIDKKTATKILVALDDDVLVVQLLDLVREQPQLAKNQKRAGRK